MDPVSAGIMAGGAAIKGITGIFGANSRKQAIKKAGTLLYDTGTREAKSAEDRAIETNRYLSDAYNTAQHMYSPVANQQADTLMTLAQQGAAGVNTAAGQANTYLDPYYQYGQKALTTMSDMAQAPTAVFDPTNVTIDPGYAFRTSEGEKTLQRSAMAKGTLMSGGFAKALSNYGQESASQEYQNAYQRALDTFKTNQQARQDQFTNLSKLTGYGFDAGKLEGENLVDAAKYGGDLTTGAQKTAGDWRNKAALQEGEWQIGSAHDQVANTIYGDDVARKMRLGAATAQANSIVGAGNATADMWGLGGDTAGSLFDIWGASRKKRKGSDTEI